MVDESQYAEFASARWMTLVRTGVLLGCTVHEAEDMAQAALEKCFVAWARVVRAEDQDAYVSKILLNTVRASRRRRWWGETPTAEVPDAAVPDATEHVAVELATRRALGRLSLPQREVVVLRYFLHLTEAQIADALAIAPGTVKSRLSRALARLAADADLNELRDGTAT
jgi:RNA polymerase sigma-70 factor (sigma-E family)